MNVAIICRDEFENGISDDFINIFNRLKINIIKINKQEDVLYALENSDALLVPGNCNDIPPRYYGEKPIENKEYNIDQFSLDKLAIELFNKNDKSILAICGGTQSINVAFGGNLNQYIQNHDLKGLHEINIDKNSFLYEVYKKDKIKVNSLHHQSIKSVAKDFSISAYSNDGIIEGIENSNIIAVQWHPEKMDDIKFFETWINKYVRR